MDSLLVVKDNLISQIDELEALQSVYPKEILISDYGILADIHNFISGGCKIIPQRLEYVVNLPIDEKIVEINILLPPEYPHSNPECYCRSKDLDRNKQFKLNKELFDFVSSQEKGSPFIFSLICWVQENSRTYFENSLTNETHSIKKHSKKTTSKEFRRYWIKSHHIYSKFKRKEIIELAQNNNLTGFCLAGKPGVICLEGSLEDCEYVWHQIKSMNWQRIFIKFTEDFLETSSTINEYRKFHEFKEVSFPSGERHNDMTQLIKYLEEHELKYAFKELFGVETIRKDCVD